MVENQIQLGLAGQSEIFQICSFWKNVEEFYMLIMNEMFLLQIENTSSEIPKKQGERFLTSKQEKEYHGWGTENVKELVKKYEGEISYQYTKERFQVEIIVYSVERK